MFGRRDLTEKRKTLKEWLQARTYMQVALTLFTISVLLFLLCLWQSVATAGNIGIGIALAGILSFAFAVGGVGVTLFGHFVVRMEGKLRWYVGLITNGAVAVIMLLLYISGIGG